MTSAVVTAITVVGSLAGVASLIMVWRSRSQRELTYRLSNSRQMYSRSLLGADGFFLELDDEPVKELFMIELELENTGDEVLDRDDFLRPLRLTVNDEARVFPVEIDRRRSDIDVEYELQQDREQPSVRIVTDLIEPGDQVTLRVLYEDECERTVVVDGRIVDGELMSGDAGDLALGQEFERRLTAFPKYSITEMFVFFLVLMGELVVADLLIEWGSSLIGATWFEGPMWKVVGILLALLLLTLGFLVAIKISSLYVERRLKREDLALQQVEPSETVEGIM